MSFEPVVPFGGYLGWQVLQRTRPAQQAAHDASAANRRDTDHFRSRIGEISSAAELVADRRLLSVALGAFGLGEDVGNRAFIQKVLEGGALDSDSLANKLADKRYLALSRAFGFGDFDTPNTRLSDFADRIIQSYREQSFEVAIGRNHEELRLAMGFERQIADVLSKNATDAGRWYTILGTPPLRKVFEAGLGLPASVAGLPIDRQLQEFRRAFDRTMGTTDLSVLAKPDIREDLVRKFLVRSQIANAAPASGASVATVLLASTVNSMRAYHEAQP